MTPKINSYIRFAGLKRSGNHAVINWLLAQFRGRICFRNNVQKFQKIDNRLCDNIESLRGCETRSKANLSDDGDKELFLASFEDHFLDDVFNFKNIRGYSRFYGHDIGRFLHILLLRDPFNYFASRIKSEERGDMVNDAKFRDPVSCHVLIHLWKQYARSYLEWESTPLPYQIPISYNRWLGDLDYRTSICQRLGIELHDDDSRKLVSGWGGGSSFSGMQFEGDHHSYLVRWKPYATHELFRSLILDDAELMELSNQIFGDDILGDF